MPVSSNNNFIVHQNDRRDVQSEGSGGSGGIVLPLQLVQDGANDM
jgi:hypothetical protein